MPKTPAVRPRPRRVPQPRLFLVWDEPSPLLRGRDSGVLPKGTSEGMKKDKKEFDADFDPYHLVNREAAKDHELVFDPKVQQYVDVFGCPVRDRFGQPL